MEIHDLTRPYNPIAVLQAAWDVADEEIWHVVDTYARMTGTDIKQAVEALEYFTYQEALEQIGER